MQMCWVGGGVVAGLAGAAFSLRVPALQFIFPALFVVLAVEAIRSSRDRLDPVLAVAAALLARWIAPNQMLLVAMGLFVATLIVRYRVRPQREVAGA
jgi:predicted branched-subunit amino acid permease